MIRFATTSSMCEPVRRAMTRTRRRSGAVRSQASPIEASSSQERRAIHCQSWTSRKRMSKNGSGSTPASGPSPNSSQSAGICCTVVRATFHCAILVAGAGARAAPSPSLRRAARCCRPGRGSRVWPSLASPSGALLSASRSTQSLRSRTVFSWRASRSPAPRHVRADRGARRPLPSRRRAARPEKSAHRAARRVEADVLLLACGRGRSSWWSAAPSPGPQSVAARTGLTRASARTTARHLGRRQHR